MLRFISYSVPFILVLLIGCSTPEEYFTNKQEDTVLPTKEEMINYDYNQSFKLANEYLKSNGHFKLLNLHAEPTTMHDAYMLKENMGTLYYGYGIKPYNNATSEIKDGRIWINVVSGEVLLIDLIYTDEVYVTGSYKRNIRTTISQDDALKQAQNFALTNQIDLNDPKFILDRTDEDFLGAYRFIWRERIDDVEVGSLTIQIHKDGKFRQMVYRRQSWQESLEPTIKQSEAKKIAKKYMTQSNELNGWDIKIVKSELIITAIEPDLHWSKKILAWSITIDITNSKKSNEMNLCQIIVNIKADTGQILSPQSATPCYIT